jgi:hypothetical protein
LIAILGAILAAALAIAAVIYTFDGERGPARTLSAAELAWIKRLHEWGRKSINMTCDSTPRGTDGEPPLPAAPTESMRAVEKVARAACRREVPWYVLDETLRLKFFSGQTLPTHTAVSAESHIDPVLGRVGSKLAEQDVQVRCWSRQDWARVNEENRAITGQIHVWAVGLAERGVIQLDGTVCKPLKRFYDGETPALSKERSELARALAVLAHEAEHERDFARTEAEVECFAVQDVRGLVVDSGRNAEFAADIAARAWDVGYLRGDPVYSTPLCRNGTYLDLFPSRDAWP